MAVTTHWSPNQASIAQVETYTFTTTPAAGNTYTATINGKTVTYTANTTDGLTTTAAATGLFNLLNASSSIAPELTEISFTNPSDGTIVATARVPGVPFANVTVNGVSNQGLVLSTGNGLANGVTTTHTTANKSPSDVNDSQNWLRVDLATTPPNKTRSLPANGDDVVVANTTIPMLWNLDRINTTQFNTYKRWQSMEGDIGLPENNPNGYTEWRATYFKFSGPQGSVPAGGLVMELGYNSGNGNGPSRERYDLGSQQVTLNILAAGSASDEYGVRFIGYHTNNTFNLNGGVSLGIGMIPGEKSTITSSVVQNGTLGIGPNVTWTAASTLTLNGGNAILNSAPATLLLNNGSQASITTDSLTWSTITAQGGSGINVIAGGTITTLTLSTGSTLDKSQDGRSLTITNSTIDGDSCLINDPLNSITFTNATSVKQSVSSGPIRFTGTRTVKVT